MIRPFGKPVAPWSDTQGPMQTRGALNQLAKAISGAKTAGVTTSVVPIAEAITGAAGGWVNGDSGAGAAFVDQVVWHGTGSAVAVSSTTVKGAPAGRTYSIVAGALSLVMASGTYTVVVAPTIQFTD